MWAGRERTCDLCADTLMASEALSVWVLSVHLVIRSVDLLGELDVAVSTCAGPPPAHDARVGGS